MNNHVVEAIRYQYSCSSSMKLLEKKLETYTPIAPATNTAADVEESHKEKRASQTKASADDAIKANPASIGSIRDDRKVDISTAWLLLTNWERKPCQPWTKHLSCSE
jgi:hypothetical protein